jgi:xylulokinase
VDDGLGMRAVLLLGVDLGTTGTRTALFTAAGEALAEAGQPTPLRWHGPGQVDQDLDDCYRGATATIAACLTQAGVKPARIVAPSTGEDGRHAVHAVLAANRSWRAGRPILLDGDGT